MKKSIIFIILGLFVFSILLNVINISPVGADSGFDSSYDSGGGSWSSSSSGSNYGSSNSSSFSGEGSLEVASILLIPYIFSGIIGFITCYNKIDSKNKFKLKTKLLFAFYILFMLGIIILEWILIKNKDEFKFIFIMENIFVFPLITLMILYIKDIPKQKIIEGLEIEKIVNDAFEIYKDLQIAWMNFDYDKIKELVSDEMYNMYSNQLEILKIKNQQNIMSEIEFIDGYINDYKKVNNKEILKIYLSVSCYDYIINTKRKTKRCVRGNRNKKLTLSYILTFERNIDIVKRCPQCGANVENLTECNYCKSKIVNNNDKLKMTKKQIVSQK